MTRLAHDYPELAVVGKVYAIRRVDAIALRQLAVQAHPHSRAHQAKWLRAIRWLRQRNRWVLDRTAKAPDWKASQEIRA
jgi:hypothetical protein